MYQMSIQLKSAREIAAMRESGRLVAEAFAMLREAIRPGVSLRELDKLVGIRFPTGFRDRPRHQ